MQKLFFTALLFVITSATAAEAGFRWVVWKGLNLRIGIIALTTENEDLKINPTSGIGYSFKS